jgi:hypothetical protein
MLKRMGLSLAAALLVIGLGVAPAAAVGYHPNDLPCAVCW